MEKKHVQAELTLLEYEALRRVSRREGRTVKDALREASVDWVRRHQGDEDPLFDLVGLAKGPKDSSAKHDEIYDEP